MIRNFTRLLSTKKSSIRSGSPIARIRRAGPTRARRAPKKNAWRISRRSGRTCGRSASGIGRPMRGDLMVRRPDEASDEADTLIALLQRQASEDSTAELFSFLPDGEESGAIRMTRGELDRRARALAARLQARGLAGKQALLIFPPGLEFISAFFGCLYARTVAVPAYAPRPNRPMTRLVTIVEDARPSVVLTCDSLRKDATRWSAGIPELAGVEVLFSDEEDGDDW